MGSTEIRVSTCAEIYVVWAGCQERHSLIVAEHAVRYPAYPTTCRLAYKTSFSSAELVVPSHTIHGISTSYNPHGQGIGLTRWMMCTLVGNLPDAERL